MTGSRSVGELARTALLLFGARLAVAEGFYLGARARPRAGGVPGDEPVDGLLAPTGAPPGEEAGRPAGATVAARPGPGSLR